MRYINCTSQALETHGERQMNVEAYINVVGFLTLIGAVVGITWLAANAIREELKRKRPN